MEAEFARISFDTLFIYFQLNVRYIYDIVLSSIHTYFHLNL